MSSKSDVAVIEGLSTSGFAVLVLFGLYIFVNNIAREPCKNIFSSFGSALSAILKFLPILFFFGGAIFFLITMLSIKNLKVSLPGIYLFNNIISLIGLIVSAFYVYGYSNFICNKNIPNLTKYLIRIIVPTVFVFTIMGFELNFILNYQTDG